MSGAKNSGCNLRVEKWRSQSRLGVGLLRKVIGEKSIALIYQESKQFSFAHLRNPCGSSWKKGVFKPVSNNHQVHSWVCSHVKLVFVFTGYSESVLLVEVTRGIDLNNR